MNVVRVPSQIFRRGLVLASLGLDERAWKPADALKLLDILMSANIAVLGGDVYVLDNGEIERTNENWYFNVKAGESSEDLVQRSFEVATKYIRQLQNSKMTNPLVTLVISDSVVECERGAFE